MRPALTLTAVTNHIPKFENEKCQCLRGIMVRVTDFRSKGPGFDPRLGQWKLFSSLLYWYQGQFRITGLFTMALLVDAGLWGPCPLVSSYLNSYVLGDFQLLIFIPYQWYKPVKFIHHSTGKIFLFRYKTFFTIPWKLKLVYFVQFWAVILLKMLAVELIMSNPMPKSINNEFI